MNLIDIVTAVFIVYVVLSVVFGIVTAYIVDSEEDYWAPWYRPLWSWPVTVLVVLIGLAFISGIERNT